MKQGTTEKIVVLTVSFMIFIGGVLALFMDRGNGRTITLTLIVAALVAVAVRQAIRNLSKKK